MPMPSAMSPSGMTASVVGWVTSGAYRPPRRRSLALGYVPAALAAADAGFEIEIIGERRAAVALRDAAFDPGGALMRV